MAEFALVHSAQRSVAISLGFHAMRDDRGCTRAMAKFFVINACLRGEQVVASVAARDETLNAKSAMHGDTLLCEPVMRHYAFHVQ